MNTTLTDRVLDPLAGCLTPEVAERIVNLRLDPQTQAQLDGLAVKASAGQLLPSEQSDYEELIETLDFVGILKSKARSTLATQRS